MAGASAIRWDRLGITLGVIGQAAVVARIAGLGAIEALPLLAAALAAAVLLDRARPAVGWMIGWGGLGMTLGWWADLGFGDAETAARLHGLDSIWCRASVAHALPGLGSLFSWMTAGMLLFGMPPAARWMRPAGLLRCAAAMAIGMAAGSRLAAAIAGSWAPAPAVIADFAAMSAGMLAGMLVAGRLARRAQMPRKAAIATSAQPATVTTNPSAPA